MKRSSVSVVSVRTQQRISRNITLLRINIQSNSFSESRRPSILPVPDMFSGSTINLVAGHQAATEDSEDEIEDDVPWPAPTEKIS